MMSCAKSVSGAAEAGNMWKTDARIPAPLMVSKATGTGDGEILFANRLLLDLFECDSLDELKKFSGGTFIGLVYPPDVDSARWYIHMRSEKVLGRASTEEHDRIETPDGTLRMQYRIQTKSGRILDVIEIAHYVKDPQEGYLVYSILLRPGVEMNFDERDSLTGFPNMRNFLDYASKVAAQNRRTREVPVYYIYLNLAHFKRFNMRHGIDEGDVYLRMVADILRRCFREDYIARFAADHFAVFSTRENCMDAIERAHDEIARLRPETTVELKAGVYKADSQQTDIAVNAACDLAKIACDQIRDNPNLYIQIYDKKIAYQVEQQTYIAENIDRAIRNGDIKVFYQPVIRSVSGALCGFEALARWMDSKYGFMSPAVFIPTLEENRLIHKLDIYVIREVCGRIRREMDAGDKPVPVSFNLSRLDFLLCDIFSIIEEIVRENGIPRDMIHIEVTESTVMRDQKRMAEQIRRFHDAGYQVWMDDFGSGYSSLNMLKDFRFDELKLDMEFLRNFTGRSREIVASTVRMAKRLNIHTLAEGVETREQAVFLRQIGCEKMQGYYFGKPEPFEESMQACLRDRGLTLETREWYNYFDRVGLVNLQTEKPLALVDYNGECALHLFFSNNSCEELVRGLGYESNRQLFDSMQHRPTENLAQIINFIQSFDWKQEGSHDHTLYISENGHYLSMSFQSIAGAQSHRCFRVYITDLTREQNDSEMNYIDTTLRDLLSVFDNVYILHFAENYMEVKFQDSFFHGAPGYHYQDIESNAESYCERMIYPMDQERFLAFFDQDTMVKRIQETNTKMLVGHFRFLTTDGDYHWKAVNCFLTSDHAENTAIVTIRPSVLEDNPSASYLYTRRSEADALRGTSSGSFLKDSEDQLERENQSALMAAIDVAAKKSADTLRRADERPGKTGQSGSGMDGEREPDSERTGEDEIQPDLMSDQAQILLMNVLENLPINLYWKDTDFRFLVSAFTVERISGSTDRSWLAGTLWSSAIS